MRSGSESPWKNIEHENENYGSTDKDWQCCCVSIVNENNILVVYK